MAKDERVIDSGLKEHLAIRNRQIDDIFHVVYIDNRPTVSDYFPRFERSQSNYFFSSHELESIKEYVCPSVCPSVHPSVTPILIEQK